MKRTLPRKLKVIVFAGAGASARLGMPTTPQFVEKLNGIWPGAKTLIQQCRKYRVPTGDRRTDNEPVDAEELRDWLLAIEEHAETLDVLSTTPPYGRDGKGGARQAGAQNFVKEIRIRFDDIIRETYGEVNGGQAYNHYAIFLNALMEFDVSLLPFFTTNYDLVLESLGDYQDFAWRIETGVERQGTSSVLNMDLFKNTSPNRPTINLFKLHGSTDWWLNSESNKIEFVRFGITPPSHYHELLIYPTRTKFEQTAAEPFSLFYDKLRSYLSSRSVHTCIVIGYSFRDSKINELFLPAMERGLRLLVLDAAANKITRRLGGVFTQPSLDKQIRVVEIDFGNWDAHNKGHLNDLLAEELGNIAQ